MVYTLPAWADSPSTATPLSAANLLLYNSAIDDLDTRAPVGSVEISAVGSAALTVGTGTTTLDVNPTAVGDVLVLTSILSSSSLTIASVSGGGVSTWIRLADPFVASRTLDMWMGVISTAGSATITVTGSGSVAAITVRLAAQQFTSTAGVNTQWAVDVAGEGLDNTSSSTTVQFPTLTPTGDARAYVGISYVDNAGQASGQTSGYTVQLDPADDPFIYNENVSTVQSPVAQQSPAGLSQAVAAIIGASTNLVTSVAAGDQTIAIGGTAAAPTVVVNVNPDNLLEAVGSSSTSKTLTAGSSPVKTVTLSANCTFTFSGATAGRACSLELVLTQDGTGGRTATWPGSVKWSGGAPTLTATAGAVDRLVFTTYDGGTTWYGDLIGKNYV